jgi:hypothetical protein
LPNELKVAELAPLHVDAVARPAWLLAARVAIKGRALEDWKISKSVELTTIVCKHVHVTRHQREEFVSVVEPKVFDGFSELVLFV